ncbi:MAG: S41 family peptidase [Fretibacterium sp.]|nr:S41 family peptidase [Fretibacterium sp.]
MIGGKPGGEAAHQDPAYLPAWAPASAEAAELTDFDRVSPFSVRSLWLMRQARYIIESYQVDAETKPASEEDLVHGAVKGMVEAWKDPYTRFVSPSQLRDEEIEMEGHYGGLGMYVGERDGQILVISPMEDSPAERAGLKPKDQIVKVNDEVVIGWNSERVVQLLRGEPDTKVTIWVRREGEDKLLSFDVVREVIKLKSVRYQMLSDDIGYLRLSQFKQKTDEEARSAVRDMIRQGAKAMVLDLRNNGGGLLDASVKIVSMFVDDGLVVETRGRAEKANEKYFVNPSLHMTHMPMTVLINGGSASASEIVAGALLDRGRAVLVGEKSFGKGSVQTLFPLTDGSGLYVTIARYYTPSGRVIDHVGLTPTIEVKGEPEKDMTKDAQLQRAISEVKKALRSSDTKKTRLRN